MVEKHQIFHFGENSTQHRNEVTREVNETVIGLMPVSNRMGMITISVRPYNPHVIYVYSPTAENNIKQLLADTKMGNYSPGGRF